MIRRCQGGSTRARCRGSTRITAPDPYGPITSPACPPVHPFPYVCYHEREGGDDVQGHRDEEGAEETQEEALTPTPTAARNVIRAESGMDRDAAGRAKTRAVFDRDNIVTGREWLTAGERVAASWRRSSA